VLPGLVTAALNYFQDNGSALWYPALKHVKVAAACPEAQEAETADLQPVPDKLNLAEFLTLYALCLFRKTHNATPLY